MPPLRFLLPPHAVIHQGPGQLWERAANPVGVAPRRQAGRRIPNPRRLLIDRAHHRATSDECLTAHARCSDPSLRQIIVERKSLLIFGRRFAREEGRSREQLVGDGSREHHRTRGRGRVGGDGFLGPVHADTPAKYPSRPRERSSTWTSFRSLSIKHHRFRSISSTPYVARIRSASSISGPRSSATALSPDRIIDPGT